MMKRMNTTRTVAVATRDSQVKDNAIWLNAGGPGCTNLQGVNNACL